jgi:hypothetical protein
MLTGFSVLPLRVTSVLGFMLTLFGVVALVLALFPALLYWRNVRLFLPPPAAISIRSSPP